MFVYYLQINVKEISTEKTMCKFTCRHQIADHDCNVTVPNKLSENTAKSTIDHVGKKCILQLRRN